MRCLADVVVDIQRQQVTRGHKTQSMETLNADIDKLLQFDSEDGTLRGKVCLVCDKFLSLKDQKLVSLKKFLEYAPYLQGHDDLPEALQQCYKFRVPGNDRANEILNGCLLSPRSRVTHKGKKKRIPHVLCCQECRSHLRPDLLKKGELPRFAIASGLTIGTAPPCLTRLNEIELALLSQARFRGHLFTYWGGCHRSISGWHSFYEVDPGHTMAVLETVQELTDAKNMAVVLCGPFTPAQKERVMRKVQVNVEWVMEAFLWLKANNRLYADVAIPSIGTPTIIDNSEVVEAENSDIETKEQISVVFPDGTVRAGGCSDGEEFEKAIADLRSKSGGTVPYLTSRPSERILRDHEDDNLMRAFPLQFPFGIGGCHSDIKERASQNGYLRHLLFLSIPHFHEASFVLVIHNMFERCKALTGAIWRVMGGNETCNVSEEDLNEAVSRKLNGLPPVNGPGESFLDSIHAVKKNMAHTNPAAQAAQAKFLSLTHHFGCPKVMFTVSFDDSLDIRILSMSGKEDAIDWITSLDDLTGDQLSVELDKLNAIRYKFPGLCGLNFEFLMDIVLDKIVGDNDLKEGLFGRMAAYGMAVEEQGRKTLHAHILVYVHEWNEILEALQSSLVQRRKEAEKKVKAFVDSVVSTALVPDDSPGQKCPSCEEGNLVFAEGQGLRNLRHRTGSRDQGNCFAKCPKCEYTFNGDELSMMRVVNKDIWSKGEGSVTSHASKEILKATSNCDSNTVSLETVGLVNHQCNHHLSHHTKTCFKKGDECRACLPDLGVGKTEVIYSEEDYEVYKWTGAVLKRKNVTVRPKRLVQDAYTNAHCKAISESKAPSNSNVQVTTGARAAIYCTCYAAKATQKEDTQEVKKTVSYVAHRFKEQRNENSLFEGLSRLMGAAIVGTSEHVVSAPMASYLVRNQSRFKFSEKFKYIPVREAVQLITKASSEGLEMSVMPHDSGCFLSSEALNYLLRPMTREFNDLCMVDFFKEYEIIRHHKPSETDQRDGTFEITNEDHPGFGKQIYRKRAVDVLPQFSHWAFPDAAAFGGDLLQMSGSVNSSVEKFCQTVLVLYHPFRNLEDLTVEGSFHRKFKRMFHTGVPLHIREVLTNVQMFYNSTRLPPKDDPLFKYTVPYEGVGEAINNDSEAEDDEDFFDGFFDVLGGQPSTTVNSADQQDTVNLDSMRKDGARGCGYYDLPPPLQTADVPPSFITSLPTRLASYPESDSTNKEQATRDKPTRDHLMSLVYRNTRRRLDPEEEEVASDNVDADGTALSIIEWSLKPELSLDAEQQKAFQIVTAAYTLTYYEDAESLSTDRDGPLNAGNLRHDFNEEKNKLLHLTGLRPNTPLRMFLDGPGGSGKSRVVKELLKYAEQFTSLLNLKFDMRTIVVSAKSGVAAVSIGGETTHSVAYLNRKIPDDDRTWANARLLIIDEVSFLSVFEVEKLDEKLRELMRRHNSLFGGLNILYCGDFKQLEPIRGTPLYSSKHADKKWIHSLNCYVELIGLWRFKDDPHWGRILSRIRNDLHTAHDIDAINECCISEKAKQGQAIPSDASYCVYSNADRCAINAGMFSNNLKAHGKGHGSQLDGFIVIKAGEMSRKLNCGKKVPMGSSERQYIFENCADHRVTVKSKSKKGGGGSKGHFVDPMLKLHYHIRDPNAGSQ